MQSLTRGFAAKIEKKLGGFGPGKGFAIMVWNQGESKLLHVTTSRAEFADMIGAQLSDWAKEHIRSEEAENTRLQQRATRETPAQPQQH